MGFVFELPQVGPTVINKTKHGLIPCPAVVPSDCRLHLCCPVWGPLREEAVVLSSERSRPGGRELCCLTLSRTRGRSRPSVRWHGRPCSPKPNPLTGKEGPAGVSAVSVPCPKLNSGQHGIRQTPHKQLYTDVSGAADANVQ